MADYLIKGETLTDIADAIRTKTNSTDNIAVKDMANEINSISSGINTNDATATAEDILSGETAYVKGNKITGTFTIDNELTVQDNLIEQITTVLDDKISEPILQDKTITPTQNQQTITFDTEYDGLNTVTVEGDNNLVAENIKSGVNIFGINGTLEIAGNNTENEDGLISGDSTIYTNERVSKVADYVFYKYSRLTSVVLPNVTSVGVFAFYQCSNLTSVDLPNTVTINKYAFAYCTTLRSINSPNVLTIDAGVFNTCKKLISINLPNAITIGSSAFWGCSGLMSVSIPNVVSIGASAFEYCGNYLASLILPKVTFIGNCAFQGCSSLSKLYLGASQVCYLPYSTIFGNASIGSNKGSIFVPASLVESYKVATNWSYYSNRIFSIDNSSIELI